MKAETVSGPGVPFQEAIDHFKAKVRIPTRAWTDVWEEGHSRAFVVAGAQKDELLAGFQEALLKAKEQGTTLAEFRRDFDRLVAAHGWTYNGSPGWRSRVIYNTNLRQAHMAGRWAQAQRLQAARPYLRYVAVMDGRTRPEHKAWHGTILPVDHPWWATHHPMNGWGCRCTAQSVSERDLVRNGWVLSEPPAIEMEQVEVRTPDGPRLVSTPRGIDPGFGYNPGRAAWGRQLADKEVADYKASGEWSKWTRLTPGDWSTVGRPPLVPIDPAKANLGPALKSREDMADALRRILGGEEQIKTLADGSPLLVNAESLASHIPLDRSPFLPLLPELLEDPYEIWITFERHEPTGRVALRKRLIKAVEVGPDKKVLLLVANSSRGVFTGWTYIPMRRLQEANRHRAGMMLWGRK